MNKEIEDVMIEFEGKKYSLRRILDDDISWEKYKNGSEVFKEVLILSVKCQLRELNRLLKNEKI